MFHYVNTRHQHVCYMKLLKECCHLSDLDFFLFVSQLSMNSCTERTKSIIIRVYNIMQHVKDTAILKKLFP